MHRRRWWRLPPFSVRYVLGRRAAHACDACQNRYLQYGIQHLSAVCDGNAATWPCHADGFPRAFVRVTRHVQSCRRQWTAGLDVGQRSRSVFVSTAPQSPSLPFAHSCSVFLCTHSLLLGHMYTSAPLGHTDENALERASDPNVSLHQLLTFPCIQSEILWAILHRPTVGRLLFLAVTHDPRITITARFAPSHAASLWIVPRIRHLYFRDFRCERDEGYPLIGPRPIKPAV